MRLHRREVLKGVSLGAGSLVLSPVLSALQAQASGAPVAARRFVFVVESNGVPPEQLVPPGIVRQKRWRDQGADAYFEAPLAGRELPVSLRPIQDFQDRLTILQGLSGRISGGGHSNHFGTLSCTPGRDNANLVGGETIDAALGRLTGGIFPQVCLGAAEKADTSVVYNLSAAGPDKPLPTLCKPMGAYAHLFGSVGARDEFVAKNNMLDFLRDDLRRVRSGLAAPEREQFDPYIESLETLRRRQSRLNEIRNTLREKGPVAADKYRSPVETDRLDSLFDLAAAALVCGLTHVVTLSSGAGRLGYLTYTGLGVQINGHLVGHGAGYGGKSNADLYNMIRGFHFELIARMARRLQAIREGDGTMLDHTLFVYLSDAAENHHSNTYEWPVVLLGNMGGRLRTGRYIDYPAYGRKRHRTTANLFTTLLRLAGSRQDRFGLPDPGLRDLDPRGPLAELMA